MRRREFIGLLGGAAAAWPRAARAQQTAKLPTIGYLNPGSPRPSATFDAFREGLRATGYVEGRNVAIEYRWAEQRYDRLPKMAADLVRRQVAVIVTSGGLPSAQAAKAATNTIPIVFSGGFDPVQVGLVTSLNRPGGNITGVTNLNAEVAPKRLELLREIVPTATILAAIVNPAGPLAEPQSTQMEAAAHILGIELRILHASSETDLEKVFVTLGQTRTGGLVIGTDAFLATRSEQIAALTLRHAIPTVHDRREFVAAGGLMSYGGSNTNPFHTVGLYTGRILKGEKPAELPVQQTTTVELIINMKTARALGVTFPTAILVRADEVIE
jgi:putative ABC transport system substrate-binding protein